MSLSVPLEPPSKEILHISSHYLVILVKYIYIFNSIDRLYYYGPGTRFGASRPFDHAKSVAFCTFLRHFRGLEWLWTTVFFSASLKDNRCLMMCSSGVGTGKSPDWSDFHPCRSRQSLAIAPGQSSWPELRKGDNQEEQSISRWRENASLDNS